MWAKQKQSGFTIVELLIVIVVIGILAAITIVAYNGIQNRAKVAALQSDLGSAKKILEKFKIDNAATSNSEIYPSTQAAAVTAGLKASNGNSITQYIVANGTSASNFCVTFTNGSTDYSITSTSSGPVAGTCITNYIYNPTIEQAVPVSWIPNNASSTIETSTVRAYSGTRSVLVKSLNTTNTYSGARIPLQSLTANQPYVLSAWVYLPAAYGSGIGATINGTAITTGTTLQGPLVSVIGSWQRAVLSFTANNNGTANFYVVTSSGSSGAASASFHFDAAMLTAGTDTYTYADGDSPGWFWTGEANNSTSVGPSL